MGKPTKYRKAGPMQVPFDDRLRPGSDDLPLDEEPLARRGSEHEPEQIHLALEGQISDRLYYQDGAEMMLPNYGKKEDRILG